MNTRESTLKTILWAILGVLAIITAVRIARGLGATTALSDATPWGLWIAFDVMAGVALAAGGFILAATVYILGREKYRPFARPAILTAFLGYAAVAVGLLYDLGLPWNIWHPVVYPQHHSVLFEVAMCVMLYLAVLILEFAPVVLEHPLFQKPSFQIVHRALKKISIPLVISGIVLSTLHQSSLGSLFLITPYRLHQLWYSPIIWILFFVSAVALGLMVVTAESFFSYWLFGHRLRMEALSGLGRAAAWVLLLYMVLRLGDLGARGLLPSIFDGSWQSYLFMFEFSVSAAIPALLLFSGTVRSSRSGLAICSGLTVFGMIGYRFDTCIVAFARPEGMSYFPSWMEVAVSVGIVASATLIFIFFVQRLKVYPDEVGEKFRTSAREMREPSYDAETVRNLLPDRLAAPRRYSLALIAGAALAIALLPQESLFGSLLKQTPVEPTRTVEGLVWEQSNRPGHEFAVAGAQGAHTPEARDEPMMMIDGNRNGRLVIFLHENHIAKLGGRESCGTCHHRAMPFDRNTSCSQCHADMYLITDIFDHSYHVKRLDGNNGCARCHLNASQAKTRDKAESCATCHTGMIIAGSIIEEPEKGMRGHAPGYMDAMHGLCITCHRRELQEKPQIHASSFDKCETCHRDPDIFRPHLMGPYVAEELRK